VVEVRYAAEAGQPSGHRASFPEFFLAEGHTRREMPVAKRRICPRGLCGLRDVSGSNGHPHLHGDAVSTGWGGDDGARTTERHSADRPARSAAFARPRPRLDAAAVGHEPRGAESLEEADRVAVAGRSHNTGAAIAVALVAYARAFTPLCVRETTAAYSSLIHRCAVAADTPNVAAAYRTLSPRTGARTDSPTTGFGRPSRIPCARALASPALTRSAILAHSNSAMPSASSSIEMSGP
jgi:hypothetical protein